MNKFFHVFFCICLALAATLHGSRDNLYFLEENHIKDVLLTTLRDCTTGCAAFQEASNQIGYLLAYKVCNFIPTKQKTVYTLTGAAFKQGEVFKKNPILVSVMRGGLSLLSAFQSIFKGAPVGMIRHKRNEENALPMLYYLNLPKIEYDDKVVVLEPMLATGGSLSMTIALLKQAGASEENIIIATVIAAPQGVERLFSEYPGINIILASLDPCLNEKFYIVPGLGDFGDRYFGNDSEPHFAVMTDLHN